MNIFFLTETESGCYKWRTDIPARYLKDRGHQIQLLTAGGDHSAPDVMVFFRAHYEKAIEIQAWCKSKGIRTVFDTDDALDLVPEQNLNFKVLQPRLPIYHHLLKTVDLVTTTTETLATHLRKSNPNVVVLPNSVDPNEWHPQPRGNHRGDNRASHRMDRQSHSLCRSEPGIGRGSRFAEKISIHVRRAGLMQGRLHR